MFELQPDIAWDKGKAVIWLLDKLVVPMVSMAAEPASAADTSSGAPANGTGDGGNGGGGGTKGVVADGGSAVEETDNPAGEGDDSWADDEDLDEPSDAGKFFTIFIGDDKTDEVRESLYVPHRPATEQGNLTCLRVGKCVGRRKFWAPSVTL